MSLSKSVTLIPLPSSPPQGQKHTLYPTPQQNSSTKGNLKLTGVQMSNQQTDRRDLPRPPHPRGLDTGLHADVDAGGRAAAAGVPAGGLAAECGYCECVEGGG